MNKRERNKLRRWKVDVLAQADQVRQVVARLQGRVLRQYVLGRSYTQFEKWWCDTESYGPVPTTIYVSRAAQLAGVRLNAVVKLIELDGWEAVADDDLRAQVRLLKALTRS